MLDDNLPKAEELQQHSSASSTTNYSSTKANGHANVVKCTMSCNDSIEEGTDVTCSTNCCNSNLFKRKSRSVGSYVDDESLLEFKNNCEIGSDPLINISSCTNPGSDITNFDDIKNSEIDQREFLEKWLDNGPALVASEENLYPEEILGVEEINPHPVTPQRQLTLRTDALINTTTFNLVKPKL